MFRRRRQRPRADARRIHELEFELGFREDAPAPVYTGRPGDIVHLGYRPVRRGLSAPEVAELLARYQR